MLTTIRYCRHRIVVYVKQKISWRDGQLNSARHKRKTRCHPLLARCVVPPGELRCICECYRRRQTPWRPLLVGPPTLCVSGPDGLLVEDDPHTGDWKFLSGGSSSTPQSRSSKTNIKCTVYWKMNWNYGDVPAMQPIYRPYVHPTCADLAISELSFNLLTPPFNNSDT